MATRKSTTKPAFTVVGGPDGDTDQPELELQRSTLKSVQQESEDASIENPVSPSAATTQEPQPSAKAAHPATRLINPTVSAGLSAAKLRIDPNLETSTVKKLLTRVGVEKRPDKQLYLRAHPDRAFRAEGLGLLEFSRDRRLYLVDPAFSELLKAYYRRYYVFTATTITRAIFLWVIPMPGEDGQWNAWHRTLYDCVLASEDRWLQVHSGNFTEPHILEEPRPDPDWEEWLYPCTTFDQLLDLAFTSTYINKPDHPVIEALLHGK